MSSEINKAAVRRWFAEVMEGGDIDLLDTLVATDVVNHAAVPERRHGIEGIKHVARWSKSLMPDQRFAIEHLIAEGDMVAAYGKRTATHRGGKVFGVEVPAGAFTGEMVHLFRFADGKVVEHWAVRDDLGMLRQLGALPKPPG